MTTPPFITIHEIADRFDLSELVMQEPFSSMTRSQRRHHLRDIAKELGVHYDPLDAVNVAELPSRIAKLAMLTKLALMVDNRESPGDF